MVDSDGFWPPEGREERGLKVTQGIVAPPLPGPPLAPRTTVELEPAERAALRLRRIAAILAALLLVLALSLRVGRVQSTPYHPSGDASLFVSLGAQIADHGDYSRSDLGFAGSIGPTAYLPPALPYLLGVGDLLDDHAASSPAGVHLARIEQAVVGTASVALIGLLAFELAGPLVALAALAIAAVYPPFIALSATLQPENLLCLFELGAVWALLRARGSRDSVPWLIATGILTGLAALSHESGLLLVIPLALAARGTRPIVGRRQVAGPGVVVVAMLLTLTPWLLRDGIELHRFVPITNRAGVALAGTYNPSSAAAANRWLPITSVTSLHALARQAPGLTEGHLDQKLAGKALTYVADHPLEPLKTAAQNVTRLLDLSHRRGQSGIDVAGFWLVAVLAALGLVTAAGRRIPRWLWSVPLIMALAVVLVNAPAPRAREAIDPFLIILAAVTATQVLTPLLAKSQRRFLDWRYARGA